MGKSKLFGSGSGKPVNSVKVTEFAGENIPANCFVKKISGLSTAQFVTDGTSSTDSDLSYSVYQIDEDSLLILHLYQSASNNSRYLIVSFIRNRVTVSQKSIRIPTRNSTYGIMEYATAAVLPNIQKIVFSDTYTPTSGTPRTYYLIVSWDSSGTLTANNSDETLPWLTSNGNMARVEMIRGVYSNDYVYFFYSPNSNYSKISKIQKAKIEGMSLVLESEIASSNEFLLRRNTFFEDLNCVISADYSGSSHETRAQSIVNGDILWEINSKSAFEYDTSLLGNTGYYEQSSHFYYTQQEYATTLERIRLTDGTQDTIKIEGEFTAATSSILPMQSPFDSSQLLVLLHSNNTKKVYMYQVAKSFNSYSLLASNSFMENTGYAQKSYCTKYKKGTVYFYWWVTGYKGLAQTQYIKPQIRICDSSTIYGITAKPGRELENTEVYLVDTAYATAAYTTYGITEALATQIVDDSVDEIKQEVTM